MTQQGNYTSGIGRRARFLLVVLGLLVAFWGGMQFAFWLQGQQRAAQVGSTGANSSVAQEGTGSITGIATGIAQLVGPAPAYPAEQPGEVDNYYAYSQLSPTEREVYRCLLAAMRSRSRQDIPTTEKDVLDRLWISVLYDHPELFDVEGGTYYTTTNAFGTRMSVEARFRLSDDEYNATLAQIEQVADGVLMSVPLNDEYYADDYTRARTCFDWVVLNCEYDLNAENNQSIESVFLGGRSVCNGYAKAFQYLLQRQGIPCVLVTGRTKAESHAWCLAKLDGEWYYVDPTWGDARFISEDERAVPEGYVNYDYLGATTTELLATHSLDGTLPVPACTAIAANYYVREGAYFETADTEAAGAAIAAAQAAGKPAYAFRCATEATYHAMMNGLIYGQEIYNFIGGTSVRYLAEDTLHTITILF